MQKASICIIDDDEIYQFTSKINLKKIDPNIQLIKFLNGEEAINYITQHLQDINALPDIILLDINMPIMNGWDFLAAYVHLSNNISKKIDIYVVSSSVDEIDYKKAKSIEQVTDYLSKPIKQETFLNIIEHYTR